MTTELNVYSKSSEPLARALSNFAHTPFELDEVQYASVEAFYQSLGGWIEKSCSLDLQR